MFAVGRLGSYISRGVNTVSGPFHPFGGAVDIVVVEQPDGSFKSSPWYIRFGKFQGVLKAREKVVNISVDGVEANFHMYLDHKGVAYFLREVDVEEVGFVLSPPSSGEEMDGQLSDRRPIKSMSCNYGSDQPSLVKQIDMSNGKAVVRTSSRRSRILGLVFGRSMKEDRVRVEEDGVSVDRTDSLERAEIAADLLEVKWSTNLAPSGNMKDNSSHFSDISNDEANKDSQLRNELLAEGSGAVNELEAEESVLVDEGNELEVVGIGLMVEGSAPVVEEIASEVVGQSGLVVQESVQMVERELVVGESLPITVGSTQVVGEIEPVVQDSRLVLEGSGPVMGAVEQMVGGSELVVDESEPALEESGPVVDGSERAVERGQVVDGRALIVEESELVVSMSGPVVEENEIISTNTNCIITETYSEMATVQTVDGSPKEVETCSVFTISSVNNTDCVVQDEKSSREEDILNKLQSSLEPVGGSQEINSDFVPFEAMNNSSPEDPEEDEQFPFSDPEDFKPREVNHSSLTSNGFEAVNESFSSNLESDSSAEKFVLEKLSSDVEEIRKKSKTRSSHIDIPRNHKVTAQEVGCMVESLPNMWSHFDELNTDHHHSFIGHSLDSRTDPSKWMLVRKDVVSCIKSDGDEECALSNSKPENEDAQILEELQNVPASNAIVAGDPSKIIDASSGSWRLWPFRRSRSVEVAQPAPICISDSNAENALESSCSMDAEKSLESISSIDTEKDIPNNGNALERTSGKEKCVPIPKANKKKIRALSPTSEQLASLNLKEGRNKITFTFSTSMLGKQQVDARIYLWRWDTRIVISDVDGTITKSDLLGQFMPLVGKDWSQTGVAHLFSAIKENGYQMLFLSARAISQAYHTRQFLFNLKQDGKALPDGPVVISPDGLFPSLFREVIRRAPHEFKISCLEDIRALFPSDRNPFYAGFGNRDTDEFSYLKVGIPKGKIFIINPKGEVVVNRRVDTKSYTSLQALVNGMFPPMSSHEQEDYNSWNFWKLPPPSMDM